MEGLRSSSSWQAAQALLAAHRRHEEKRRKGAFMTALIRASDQGTGFQVQAGGCIPIRMLTTTSTAACKQLLA